jgi:bis(5'-adenosyl)-triphosphatase
VQKTLGRVYKATAFNVAVQDGKDAGQTVPHVHVHVIPRQTKDMDSRGGGDKVYEMLEGDEGDIAKELKEREDNKPTFKPDAERTDRSKEEMENEAAWLAEEMAKDDMVE